MSDKDKPQPTPTPTPQPRPAFANPTGPEAQAQAMLDVQREADEREADEGEPGGRYLINSKMVKGKPEGGTWVDAEGKPLKDKKDEGK